MKKAESRCFGYSVCGFIHGRWPCGNILTEENKRNRRLVAAFHASISSAISSVKLQPEMTKNTCDFKMDLIAYNAQTA